MKTISATLSHLTADIDAARLGDIAPIFNLIQQCAQAGVMNSFYLLPTYQAGLALQLFSVLLFDRIRLPGGEWSRASLEVVRKDGQLAGFALLRDSEPGVLEIYMMAIDPAYQRQGLGRSLLDKLLDRQTPSTRIDVSCLQPAQAMKRLLRAMKFQPLPYMAAAGGLQAFQLDPPDARRRAAL